MPSIYKDFKRKEMFTQFFTFDIDLMLPLVSKLNMLNWRKDIVSRMKTLKGSRCENYFGVL